ncbi:hypothetical protein JHW43_002485 [Diplocarpon mali]|nr:hypothetical protein JHW43_002485 [Diplocarpon mali]
MQMAAEGQKGACWLMSSPKAFHDEDGARLARAGSDGGYRSDLVCHPDLIIPTISHISANVQDQSEITDERRGRFAGAWSASPHSCAHLPSVQLASIRPGRPALPGDDATKPLHILESEISRLRSSVSSALLCSALPSSALLCSALLCPPLPSSALLRSAPLPPGPTKLSSFTVSSRAALRISGGRRSRSAPYLKGSPSSAKPATSTSLLGSVRRLASIRVGPSRMLPCNLDAAECRRPRLQAATDGEAGLHNLLSWVSATGL